jgi:hypothetical protein
MHNTLAHIPESDCLFLGSVVESGAEAETATIAMTAWAWRPLKEFAMYYIGLLLVVLFVLGFRARRRA